MILSQFDSICWRLSSARNILRPSAHRKNEVVNNWVTTRDDGVNL